jgi:hypothetical protein
MEAVVISSAAKGQTDCVRGIRIERRRHRTFAVPLLACTSLVLAFFQRSDAQGQEAESTGTQPNTGSRVQTIVARDPRVPPRPGERGSSASRTSASDSASALAPAPDSKPDIPPAVTRSSEKRFKVRDAYSRLVVARFHGQRGDETAVVLPDGQLGYTTMHAPTDEPFRPTPAEELASLLHQGPYAKFLLLKTDHYLIFYQSSLAFAEDSGRLLEEVYRGLIDAFTRNGIPVRESEFPLVAVIYATDRDFRADKKLEPQVRAYYEFFTNRIYFYQRSEHDRIEPKVAALLKPQTVAHEGVHQVLCNIGVQPRLSAWPLWLVEGMAEYCATTNSTRKGVTWAGLGGINPLNMATIRELDDPLAIQVNGANPPAFQVAQRRLASRTESLVTETRLTPTDYAHAWALTHYLALKRSADFVKYLKHMGQLPPLKPRSPEEHLADFRKFFGEDLAKIDKKVDEYVRRLSQKKEYDRLPYYAVMSEQILGNGAVKRVGWVSQSPQMIQQWVQERWASQGEEPNWRAIPFPSRARAELMAQQWVNGF